MILVDDAFNPTQEPSFALAAPVLVMYCSAWETYRTPTNILLFCCLILEYFQIFTSLLYMYIFDSVYCTCSLFINKIFNDNKAPLIVALLGKSVSLTPIQA